MEPRCLRCAVVAVPLPRRSRYQRRGRHIRLSHPGQHTLRGCNARGLISKLSMINSARPTFAPVRQRIYHAPRRGLTINERKIDMTHDQSFAPAAIAISLKPRRITRITSPDGRGARRACLAAIGVIGRTTAPEPLRLRCRRAAARSAVTMPPAILAVVMAAVGGKPAGMGFGSDAGQRETDERQDTERAHDHHDGELEPQAPKRLISLGWVGPDLHGQRCPFQWRSQRAA